MGFISRKPYRFLFMPSAGFTSFIFSSIDDLFRLYAVFDAISSNIDEVYSSNPYANVVIFGDFNVHHKDWLAYSKLLGWLTFILEFLVIVNTNRPSFIHLYGFSS